ncbi:CG34309 [Drosophila busckii]|uniref:CG34309 n=2 Tax=Drosophila busckii TaxID=30019 RepID=A0A0M4F3L7_DROBS|nr:CG34309 [Drosophila busckii]
MVQTIFWLPKHLKQNQERLEAMATQLGKDMSPEERAEIEKIINSKEPLTEEHLNKLLDNVKEDEQCEPKKLQ